MSFIRVIVDLTKRYGCPDCPTYRQEMYNKIDKETKLPIKPKHWQICKEHKRCIRLQHIAHQPETETAIIAESFDEYQRIMEEIEREDGSLERQLNLSAETKYEIKKQALDPEYCPEPPAKTVIQKTKRTSAQEQLILSLLSPSKGTLLGA